MTNNKQQLAHGLTQTMQHGKKRVGDGIRIMKVPIESDGNNVAVRRVGNCITATAH